ncbi:hypothetical protein Bcep1808_6256 [Burkholderia vietnamiensis G4]|uniref:Uncharacterized protein n=1 Tax=Burkholderia vietnamiensis (strain G4 / LMG 22486) TaxID=269482 RepID=A4JSA4_BURVG|nr:hypothetical protein Bcep1808_6256 [Burkholderia vietnamiensis G4]
MLRMCLGNLLGRQAAERAVRPLGVVSDSPRLDQSSGATDRYEPVLVASVKQQVILHQATAHHGHDRAITRDHRSGCRAKKAEHICSRFW